LVLGRQCVAEAGKESLNHAVGEEGHVNLVLCSVMVVDDVFIASE